MKIINASSALIVGFFYGLHYRNIVSAMDIDVLIVLLLSLILVFAVMIWMRPVEERVEEGRIVVRNVYPSDWRWGRHYWYDGAGPWWAHRPWWGPGHHYRW
jgi:hypothetical protein